MSLKNKLLNILYSLPFGLKGADSEIFGASKKTSDGTTISQEVSDERVGKHLLKGEVTQPVEELRYRTYKVSNESKNYNVVGNGVAVKNEEKKKKSKTRIRFSQENENICESVLQTLKQVDKKEGGVEMYRFEFSYVSFPRFKLEKYATMVDVDINMKTNEALTVLHFNTDPNPYDQTSKPFINELLKIESIVGSEYALSRNDITSSMNAFSFSTYKAYNEDDFTSYSFIGNPKLVKFDKNDHEVMLTFSWESFIRVPLNLEEKYYSKTMDEKYKNHERKNVDISLKNVERKRYCSVCGKEMSVYDGDIQEANGSEIICKECLEKALKNKQ